MAIGLFWAENLLFWPHFLNIDFEFLISVSKNFWPHFCQNFGKHLAEMSSQFFGGLNQKSSSIAFVSHGKILIVAEVIRLLVTDTLGKNIIEIWPFMRLFGG